MRYLRQGKSTVETGELREKIKICERQEITDRKTGIQKLEYVTLKETRAKVIGENGKEFIGANRELSRIRKRIFIRRRKDIKVNEDHFIEYEGHIYSIYEIVPLDLIFQEVRIERVEK